MKNKKQGKHTGKDWGDIVSQTSTGSGRCLDLTQLLPVRTTAGLPRTPAIAKQNIIK